jgi:hypothetical protein
MDGAQKRVLGLLARGQHPPMVSARWPAAAGVGAPADAPSRPRTVSARARPRSRVRGSALVAASAVLRPRAGAAVAFPLVGLTYVFLGVAGGRGGSARVGRSPVALSAGPAARSVADQLPNTRRTVAAVGCWMPREPRAARGVARSGLASSTPVRRVAAGAALGAAPPGGGAASAGCAPRSGGYCFVPGSECAVGLRRYARVSSIPVV